MISRLRENSVNNDEHGDSSDIKEGQASENRRYKQYSTDESIESRCRTYLRYKRVTGR